MNNLRWLKIASLSLATICGGLSNGLNRSAWALEDPVKITYDDHIKPIMREHCTSCHNANDKKSGLALDTYQAVLAGGSGGEIVYAGEIDSSRLYGLVSHQEQPFMPPNQDMIAQAKVDLIKTWIEQGMPENSGSEIKKAKANNMALKVTMGRPEGAPPMPTSMLKQTPFATARASTISALAASPWAPLVAVGGQKQVTLYHSETGDLLGVLPFPEGEPQSITFSRDGKLVLVGGGRHSHSGYAALYDIARGDRITRVGDELDIVLSADINDDNSLIAVAGPQKLVRVYDTMTGELKYEQKKHTDWIYSVRFSPDGLLLASSDRSAGLVIWEAETGRLYLDLAGHKGEVRSIAWRPDSAALISASMDGTLKMWEMNEGKVLKSWDAHGGGAMAIDVCNDGTMVSTGGDNKVKVWDINGNAAGEMPALAEAGHEVAITVDSKQVAAGDWAGNVRLWQRANPADEKSIPANPLPLDALLANAQSELARSAADLEAKQMDLVAKNSQLETLQREIAESQATMAATEAELTNVITKHQELEPNLSASQAELKTVAEQLAALTSDTAPTRKLLELAAANITKLENEKAEVASQTPADEASKSAQTAKLDEIAGQLAIQSTASNQYTSAIQPAVEQIVALEAKQAELEPKVNALAKQFQENATLMETLLASKVKVSADIAAKTQALPPLQEAMGLAKLAAEAASATHASLQLKSDGLQTALQAFQSRAVELQNQKATLEQSITDKNALVGQTQSEIDKQNETATSLTAKLQNLEAQLKAIQSSMDETNKAKQEVATAVTAKQDELSKLQTEMELLESEVATSAARIEMYQQAYGSK